MAIFPLVQVGNVFVFVLHIINLAILLKDMYGFKIEVPKREGSLKDKPRPIYLDMQVRAIKALW